jgi:RHS repeat-associated protein
LGNWTDYQQNDGNGNVNLDQSRTSNPNNQITSLGGGAVSPIYDLAGNMTSDPQPLPLPGYGTYGPQQTVAQGYVYDAWNRLVAVGDISSGDAAVTYQYDGLGRKTMMATTGFSGEATAYYYAGRQMIVAQGEWVDGYMPGPSYRYVYSARGSNIPILRDGDDFGWGNCPSRVYYLTDADNNVTTLLSATGSVLERYTYNAYGFAYIFNDAWSIVGVAAGSASSEAYNNTILFGCMDVDPNTGLYHTESRWYDPVLGVFTTRDPAAADVNLYRYCGNNPVGYSDPTGLEMIPSLADQSLPFASSFFVQTANGPLEIDVPQGWTIESWVEDSDGWNRINIVSPPSPPPNYPPGWPWGQEIEQYHFPAPASGAVPGRELKDQNIGGTRGTVHTWKNLDGTESFVDESGHDVYWDEEEGEWLPVGTLKHVLDEPPASVMITEGLGGFGAPALVTRILRIFYSIVQQTKPSTQQSAPVEPTTTSKIQGQMGSRGWTGDSINETVNNPSATSPATNKATGGDATAYFNEDGSYVVVDNTTHEVIQVSNRNDPGWIPDPTIQNPPKPK